MRRLKLELKQTMELYSTACKEALAAKQKEMEMHCWRLEEERRLEEARFAQEAAFSIVDKERAKCKAAIEAAEASKKMAELEALRRANAETKALKDAEEMKKVLDTLNRSDARCRMYTIEEIEAATNSFDESYKIGEGGYGPVFKCYLDHTPVAVKVLRPDAAHGKSQFQQEVEVLSRIRHPNMVLLLGACPEHGCLVYEFMANGCLEDRLFRRHKSPVLSWQLRFRIAAEVATGLMFLHQTKPEPLVHRDLKPANILLGYNYVSKISDVGLVRLVPPPVAENMTQYRITSTAGTFCYIDPEYQQTGMLAVKSDVYSLGIVLLQLITAKPPMGITHNVSTSIENGNFSEMLDPDVPNWPVEEALCIAQLALQCAELRRKDRPDLGKVVLPELNRLRDFADESILNGSLLGGAATLSPRHSYISNAQEVMADPSLVHSGSSRGHSNTLSHNSQSVRV
ncbi:U-box domain-containing protein 35-like [Rhodamnia argentea]|uniref:RING-type E3 ubiquitin transferase n=1 Tax=Rhodamnia argentea TaxID=178133 RepID=A0ABM3H3S6_9MYRT|nr:U-box domain-containing protein 35-like [Rhodamnia argentea]XP_048131266.1 U-box domain-containing protein 35-like [Rhodamnia argentea]